MLGAGTGGWGAGRWVLGGESILAAPGPGPRATRLHYYRTTKQGSGTPLHHSPLRTHARTWRVAILTPAVFFPALLRP